MLVGALASAINAVAGGGSLISFPFVSGTLGLGPLVGNATNSVGLWPGALSGALAFRFSPESRRLLKGLVPATAAGAAFGAWLLTVTPSKTFAALVPWLILLGAMLLLLQPRIRRLVDVKARMPLLGAVALQFLVAVYGGYFGAGMGLMMLAVLGFVMDGTIHELNGVKNGLGLVINLVGSTIFFFGGLVRADVAGWLVAGALAGGYLAGRYSQRIPPEGLRKAVAIFGVGMALYYFVAHRS